MAKKVVNIEVENEPEQEVEVIQPEPVKAESVENEPEQKVEVTQPEPVKAELVEKTYTVYAPFFLFDKEFGVGEKFHTPFNFQPADKIESVQRKGRPNRGTSFSVNGKVIVLPVE